MAKEPEIQLLIDPRPQISVELSEHGDEITIITWNMSSNMETVEHNRVTFPVDCAEEIGKALLDLAKK